MSSLPSAILFCCALLAIGLTLRATVGLLRGLFIPAAVVAGVLGFVLIQSGFRIGRLNVTTIELSTELSGWPGTLIAVVFAGLLLEKSSGATFGQAIRRGARSALLAWIIILGQIVIGLIVLVVLVRPAHPQMTASFGQLLEVSWAGGPGSAASMGDIYEKQLAFPQGRDLAFFLATAGLVYGVISGLVLVNLAIRRGWLRAGAQVELIESSSGLERNRSVSIAFAKARAEVLEPLVLQIVILAAAFAAGAGLRYVFIRSAGAVLGADSQYLKFVSNIPLFLFTLLGGLLVRVLMSVIRIDDLIDGSSIQRLVGVSMEFLIVAAIATMRLDALTQFFVPIVALIVLAAIWSVFCLLVIARRILPQHHWFELGLLNYGFSTANTPQGMMLLRIIDPELTSGAAEEYAFAAPLSAPFVGGGLITFVVLPAVLQRVPAIWVALVLGAITLGLFLLGRRLTR
jgi:ESS family glutamate:Na+ symporter